MEITLAGWDITHADEVDWVPWGGEGTARAKVLGSADGYTVAFVEASPGYRGTAHEHTAAEFFSVIDGTVRNQGVDMKTGDGYAAAMGSTHSDFSTASGATYLIIFKL
jgi:mannose-6-phosphate isomerase-like protein (cupin superfamily)